MQSANDELSQANCITHARCLWLLFGYEGFGQNYKCSKTRSDFHQGAESMCAVHVRGTVNTVANQLLL
jgi:hypothetical protein